MISEFSDCRDFWLFFYFYGQIIRFSGEIAFVLESKFGSVCYVEIDIDPELKYPKGAASVTYNTTKSFVAAISGKFVNIPHGDGVKRVAWLEFVLGNNFNLYLSRWRSRRNGRPDVRQLPEKAFVAMSPACSTTAKCAGI